MLRLLVVAGSALAVSAVALSTPGCQTRGAGSTGSGSSGSATGSTGSGSNTGDSNAGSGSGGAPDLPLCTIGRRALDHLACGSAVGDRELALPKQAFEGIVFAAGKTQTDPKQFDAKCGQMILALDVDLAKSGCSLGLSVDERQQINTFLTAWFAQRTQVTPTGDATADAFVAKIATVRDAMCACQDVACMTKIDAELDSLGTPAADTPQAARDLGGKLLDDIGRCEARIQYLPSH